MQSNEGGGFYVLSIRLL